MSENPFENFIDFLTNKHGEELWVTVYKQSSIDDTDHDGGMYCALVDKEKTEQAMQETSWDLMIDDGRPGFCTVCQGGESTTTYHTNSDDGFLRLVLVRDFHRRKESYIEILEEFRLFHNLYYDEKRDLYIDFDKVGDEVEVIKANRGEVKIRRSCLRHFMAARQMNLLLYFESARYYKHKIDFSSNEKNESLIYGIRSGDYGFDGYISLSTIRGKKLLRCESMEKCAVWPFESEKIYQDFIIGGDSDEPVTFSCNPDKLADYFGKNPDAPNYVTPVFFSKEVMQKYYNSSNYEVTDGLLRRTGAWSLRFDNNSPDHVSAFLGDLGSGLPSKEQIYWRSFNSAPDGRKISRANFERSFLANPYPAENPEYRFKEKFKTIQEYWNKKYGWNLFLPLSSMDKHFYDSLRSMLTNEQKEFDEQVLALTKVTIESINIKFLRSHLKVTDKNIKSIPLMELLLKELESPNSSALTGFLRNIQSVRSTGVAHRKGEEYEKAMSKLNIDDSNYISGFNRLLLGMVFLLEELMRLDSGNNKC